MNILGQVLYGLLWFFVLFLMVRLVFDWVQVFARRWSPSGVLLVCLESVYTVTDPPIKALRRLIPPLRIGQFAIDVSFLLVLIIAYILLGLVPRLFPI